MVFDQYEIQIRSDAVTVLFWIFFFFYIYSLFFAGESPSLVKNVEPEFEIKPRHPIYIYIYIYILSLGESVDGGDNSILKYSFFFCFSRPIIFQMLDLHFPTKK